MKALGIIGSRRTSGNTGNCGGRKVCNNADAAKKKRNQAEVNKKK